MRRNAEELAKMRKAGRVVAEMHEATRAIIRPGISTMDIDRVARQVLETAVPDRTSSTTTAFPRSSAPPPTR